MTLCDLGGIIKMQQHATGYGLIEGPVWDASRGLIFSDVVFGGAWCLRADDTVSEVFAHKKGMGGMALHVDGGLVVSGRNISYKPPGGGPSVTLLDPDINRGELGFNDLTVDPEGRIYAGSVAFRPVGSEDEPKPGALYLIDLDGSASLQWPDIKLTNGIGTSPDSTRVYHSDSLTHAVWAYDRDSDGRLSNRSQFAYRGDDRTPDGFAVAEDGSVWIADARRSKDRIFNADGTERAPLSVPLPMVTSVCFGGKDMQTLYVVTGSRGSGSDRGGAIFSTRVDVPGLDVALASVPIG
jgi:D-xylonolactonase